MVEDVCEALNARGYTADRIHGDISQGIREKVIRRFRDNAIEILVATDVAARGLDIDDIELVFNYDLPYDPEDYVHRIGRTGRAGRSGKSITFVYGRDIRRLEAIERYIRQSIRRTRIPSQEEVEGYRADKIFNQLRDKLEAAEFKNYDHQVDRLLDAGHTPTDIASALIDMLHTEDERSSETIAEDNEPYQESARGPRAKHRKGKYPKRGYDFVPKGKFRPKERPRREDKPRSKAPHKAKSDLAGSSNTHKNKQSPGKFASSKRRFKRPD